MGGRYAVALETPALPAATQSQSILSHHMFVTKEHDKTDAEEKLHAEKYAGDHFGDREKAGARQVEC